MEEQKKRTISQRLEGIVSGVVQDDVLAAIWNTAPFLNGLFGVNLRDYYMNPEIKLKVQTDFQDLFPDFICFPGIWADYGALCEPSAFDCPIFWPEGGLPTAKPAVSSMKEAVRLTPADPQKDGYMPQALKEYRYFWDHLNPRYIEEYGYLEGAASSFGPVELAAVLLGHSNFFVNLFEEPAAVHELCKITTDTVVHWLRAQETVNGPLKRICLADHIPGQVDPGNFEEFWLPYTNHVRDAFPEAMIIYHNEFPIRYVERLLDFSPHIFHFGGDLPTVKAAIGDRVTLMGNLHPINLLLNGAPEEVMEGATECLAKGAPGGRFLLSSAGGLAPGVPRDNLAAMMKPLKCIIGEGIRSAMYDESHSIGPRGGSS